MIDVATTFEIKYIVSVVFEFCRLPDAYSRFACSVLLDLREIIIVTGLLQLCQWKLNSATLHIGPTAVLC